MHIDLWPGRSMEFMPYLETYLLKTEKPLGAVIVCPGGAYTHRARHEADPVAVRFNELGFHAFVLEYRVDKIKFPEPQQDAFRAIKIIRQHAAEWKIVPDQIAIGGFSAGGHLAASAGVFFDEVDASAGDAADAFPQRPDALFPCYPVIDVDPNRFGHASSGAALAGEKNPSQETIDKLSLQFHVTEKTPPAVMWHTADDGVKAMNSIAFAQAIWARGGTAELHIFAHGPHGLGLAEKYENIKVWPQLTAQFLKTVCNFTTAEC